MEQLSHVCWSRPKEAVEWLSQLAHGHAESPGIADMVFNDLITHETYDGFVEVFSAYNDLLKEQAEAQGKRFESSLRLQLPRGWVPGFPDRLHEAFGRIRVHRVEVVGPPLGLEGCEEPGDVPIPVAVCEGLATLLLKAGTTTLAVQGVLFHRTPVVDAMVQSASFDSLELGAPWRKRPLTMVEKGAYAALIGDAKVGEKLRKLAFFQGKVVDHLKAGMAGGSPRWAGLQSLRFEDRELCSVDALQWLLNAAIPSKALSELSLSLEGDGLASCMKTVFVALRELRSLSRLVLSTRCDAETFEQLAAHPREALQLACEVDSLRHLQWAGNFSASAMFKTRWERPAKVSREPASPAGASLKDPRCRLESFSLSDMPLTRGFLGAFAESVVDHPSLNKVDFSSCVPDIEGAVALMKALAAAGQTRDVALPRDLNHYFWASAQQRNLYRLDWRRFPTPGGGSKPDLRFHGREGAPPPDAQPTEALKADAMALPHQLLDYRMRHLEPRARPELVTDVAHLLATMGQRPDAALLQDIAGRVVASLERDGALRKVVHLTALGKTIRDRGMAREQPLRRHDDLKPYVRLKNRQAVAQDRPDAPLSVNRRDDGGANAYLMKALATGKAGNVAKVLSAGGIDFGGKALRKAPAGLMRLAFLEVNRVDKKGANVRLMAVVKANDPKQLHRLLQQNAIDFDGRVLKAALKDLARQHSPQKEEICALLSLNVRDERGANKAMMGGVRGGLHAGVWEMVKAGAIDFDGHVVKTAGQWMFPSDELDASDF